MVCVKSGFICINKHNWSLILKTNHTNQFPITISIQSKNFKSDKLGQTREYGCTLRLILSEISKSGFSSRIKVYEYLNLPIIFCFKIVISIWIVAFVFETNLDYIFLMQFATYYVINTTDLFCGKHLPISIIKPCYAKICDTISIENNCLRQTLWGIRWNIGKPILFNLFFTKIMVVCILV